MEKRKVLVVDDEASIRDVLSQMFNKAGYEVHTAESAEKAMEILKRESIMVMFLDLHLPGMTGVDFCRHIRKENWIGIVNAITGYTDLFGLLECRRAGFDDFFQKPVKVAVLLKAAQEAFEKIERWNVQKYNLM